MSSAIFFVKIYRRLHIAILVPTKKDSILVEGKSLEFALFVDLDWDFSLIEWTSDIVPFEVIHPRYRYCPPCCACNP